MTFANCNKDVLDWIHGQTGVGGFSIRKATSKARPGYLLQMNSEAAESLLQELLLHLHVKRERASLAIAFQQKLRDPSLNARIDWQLADRARMQQLNQRGV